MRKFPVPSKRVIELAVLGSAAGFAVACGDQLADMAGMMAEDAGDMLVDAGSALRDSGAAMLDASGELLDDAGHALKDAGQHMQDGSHQMAQDAKAQDACITCSASGAQRTISAGDDPEQYVEFVLQGTAWTLQQASRPVVNPTGEPTAYTAIAYIRYADLGPGPLMVTDIAGGKGVYKLPVGTPCYYETTTVAGYGTGFQYLPSAGLPLVIGAVGSGIHGARFLVRENEHLCAIDNYGFSAAPQDPVVPAAPGAFGLTGYRPYE